MQHLENIEMIQEIEDSRIPKGRIDLIGFGRLGLRTSENIKLIF